MEIIKNSEKRGVYTERAKFSSLGEMGQNNNGFASFPFDHCGKTVTETVEKVKRSKVMDREARDLI
jgi:hypothetical protein